MLKAIIISLFLLCANLVVGSLVMEWTKQLLSKSSTRSMKQLNVSATPVACGSNVDDFSSHIAYNNDVINNVCQPEMVTSSPSVDSYRSVGNCNGSATAVTSSCAVEHRMTAAQSGTPMRTVSISRSGRYKSKSKQRARLLSGDVDQLTTTDAATPTSSQAAASATYRQLSYEPSGSASWNTSSSPPVTSPNAEAAKGSTAFVTADSREQCGTSATCNAVESVTSTGLQTNTSSLTSGVFYGSSSTPSPSSTADNALFEDSISPRLEVAFESTDL
jgi:hypothetical protein